MAAIKEKSAKYVLAFFLALLLLPGTAGALPKDASEVRSDPIEKNRQIIMLVIDGLQAESVGPGLSPNINGLGMAGVRVDRVSTMPPDNTGARFYTMLSGADPAGKSPGGNSPDAGGGTLLSYLEGRGQKTAMIDGTGSMQKACGAVSHKYPGPFGSDAEVMGAALEVIKGKKPFLTVAVLSGPGRQLTRYGAQSKAYQSSVTSADNEVGRLLKQLQADGTYDATMIVVAGTTDRPPLIIKGSEFIAGTRLPPVCLRDLAPTLGYLYGVNIPGARGLVMWNALRPAPDRTESFMTAQRIRDLSTAYSEAVEAAARLENEKIMVQEEKSRLSSDKKMVEDEIEAREREIGRLNRIISAFKIGGMLAVFLFATALVLEYRILKKRYLFFT